jgi:hypothetical protein
MSRTTQVIMMRYSLAIMWVFTLFGAITARADGVLPPRFNFDRYSAMVDHSPFAIATAIALPEATPDFAKDLYVANAARSPEGDMVTIASSSDQNFKKYLTTRESVDGYTVASIEWSDRVGATKVTISKDGNFATLTFNQALLTQASSRAPPTPGQLRQGVPLVPPAMPPQARTRDVIQRNPRAAAIPTPSVVPASTPNLLEPPSLIDPQQLQQQLDEEQLAGQRRRKADPERQ